MIDQVIQPNSLPNEEKRTFIHNFYENADDIFQLCMSDAIWKNFGYDKQRHHVSIDRKMIDSNTGYLYINDKPVLKFFTDFTQTKWILYVKNND